MMARRSKEETKPIESSSIDYTKLIGKLDRIFGNVAKRRDEGEID